MFTFPPAKRKEEHAENITSAVGVCRAGIKDIWNAFMAEGAKFCEYDIPFCPTTAVEIPRSIITWEEAKQIHKRRIACRDYDYRVDAFVCWYIDDQKFDGYHGIWHNSSFTLKVLHHFAGAITPDFSTYQDFPEAIKLYNTYRMRIMGYWLGKNGIPVVNNVRWGTPETYRYSFAGIPANSIVAIGTCGGSPRKLADRERFERGLKELMKVLTPHTILVYGSANYPCFKGITEQGIKVVSYPSQTARAFEGRKRRE